jgi:serum/glucocorticoid-regulated kinase 2
MDRHGFTVSAEAKDLISKMLEKDRRKRLGKKNDVQEILSHPFFKDLDIEKLKKKELVAPYIPKTISDEELLKKEVLPMNESEVR